MNTLRFIIDGPPVELNLPVEQALGLAECITAHAPALDGRGHVLVQVGDGGLSADPLVLHFTLPDRVVAAFEVNAAGTIEEL